MVFHLLLVIESLIPQVIEPIVTWHESSNYQKQVLKELDLNSPLRETIYEIEPYYPNELVWSEKNHKYDIWMGKKRFPFLTWLTKFVGSDHIFPVVAIRVLRKLDDEEIRKIRSLKSVTQIYFSKDSGVSPELAAKYFPDKNIAEFDWIAPR